jgi:hypothetical protein
MMPAAQLDQVTQLVFATAGPQDLVMDGQSAEVAGAMTDLTKTTGTLYNLSS